MDDSTGRHHEVWFRTFPYLNTSECAWTRPQVKRVELAAFGGEVATYPFTYWTTTFPLCYKNLNPDFHRYGNLAFRPLNLSAPHLREITLPIAGNFDYTVLTNTPSGSTACDNGVPGTVQEVFLPTGGRVQWDYGLWHLPGRFLGGFGPGVVERRTLNLFSVLEGTWTYQNQKIDLNPQIPDLFETRAYVVSPDTSLDTEDDSRPCRMHAFQEDGLPYTLEASLKSDDFYLSSQTWSGPGTSGSDPPSLACAGEKIRSEYVVYDPAGLLHRQLTASRTVYHDDLSSGTERFADTVLSDFDGLGHYRTAVTDGNFTSGNVRQTFTDYNPDRGTFDPANLSSYSMIPPTAEWITETFTERRVTEGSVTARESFCFDQDTGFLERHRVHLGTGDDPGDLLVEYSKTDSNDDGGGFVERERYYGGDLQALDSGDLCTLSAGLPAYEIDHSYSKGTLSSSRYLDADGEEVLLAVNRTIDPDTGLVKSRRDSAGAEARFEYNELGLVAKKYLPEGGDSEYEYRYLGGGGTSVSGVLSVLGIRVLDYYHRLDGFGRLSKEESPSWWNKRKHEYNGAGLLARVSEWDSGANWTEYRDYDPFGRPLAIWPPDGQQHEVSFEYEGDAVVRRTVQIAGATGEFPSTTEEEYDRQGRLIRVTEPSGEGGAMTSTTYGYDVGGRLASVTTQATVGGSPVTQEREFNHDHLGFLRSERHPEKGATGNGTVVFSDYDARGHATRKTDGSADLTFTYDRAERLVEVRDAGAGVLKSFVYGSTNSGEEEPIDRAKGKLVQATRHNRRPAPFDDEVVVSETYEYKGLGGRVSKRTTELDGVPRFEQTWSWLPTGWPFRVGYPDCVGAACAGAPARQLLHNYLNGQVNKVCESSDNDICGGGSSEKTISFTFHGNGMLQRTTFPYPSSVRLQTSEGAYGMRRPRRMWSYQGSTTLFNSGEYAYDGAGNVKAMGSDAFAYDGVSRLVSGTTMQGTFAQTNTYDPFGNRVAVDTNGTLRPVPADSATNRLLGQPEGAVSYDAAGNLTQWGPATYTYDALNMPIQQTGLAGRTYVYTADDERLATYVNEGSQSSTWTVRGLDGKVLRVVSEDGTGAWTWEKDYVYREGSLLASESADHGTWNYHLDHLGTVRVVTSAVVGVNPIVSRHDYYGFGEEAMPTYEGETLRFTGHERDEVSYPAEPGAFDLDYMHARYCSPVQGRFLSVDPIDSSIPNKPQSWNRYSYVFNNPLKWVDPNGECAAPAGLGEGQVGICLEAFIAAPRIGDVGLGDNRSFTGNDPSATARVSFKMIVDPRTGQVLDQSLVPGVSKVGLTEGLSVGLRGTAEIQGGSAPTASGTQFSIFLSADNGLNALNNFGTINALVNLLIDRQGGVKASGVTKRFPSIEGYAYRIVQGELVIEVLFRNPEEDPEDLHGPMDEPLEE